MRTRPTVSVSTLALAILALAGCAPVQVGQEQGPAADRIAFAGHGMLFDREMKPIRLDAATVTEMQTSMMEEILKASAGKLADDTVAVVQEARKLLSSQLGVDETIALRSGIIGSLLRTAPAEIQAKYAWRNRALASVYWSGRPLLFERLNPRIRILLDSLRVLDPSRLGRTAYMNDCRTHNVPVPPDWAESGTDWVQQGTLTTNMLQPGQFAAVWTYTDPSRRGACIALPRGNGAPGSPAGIICQSATTGYACFWDNKLRDDPADRFIGWSGQRLVISQLQDGSNLDSPCTGCHRGNNVYLIAPDDTTWARVLRRSMAGPTPGTFTTRVEASSDTRGGGPRYIPITTLPERPGWENTYVGYCGGCHEAPASGFTRPSMPPACAGAPGGCYRP